MRADDIHREFRRQVRLSTWEVDPAFRREVAGLVRRLYPIDSGMTGAVIESPEGLGESDAQIEAAIARQVTMFRQRRQNVQWSTYGDDPPRDLPARLGRAGFWVGPAQVLMLGAARLLADDNTAPTGVRLRPVEGRDWPRLYRTFLDASGTGMTWTLDALRTELDLAPEHFRVAVAEDVSTDQLVAISGLRLVPRSEFAEVAGPYTAPSAQGRGISRAMSACQAGAALAAGQPYVRLDVPPMLQSALHRLGMLAVTTTTVCRLLVRPRAALPEAENEAAFVAVPG